MKNYQSPSSQNELLIRKINEEAQCDQELEVCNEYLRKPHEPSLIKQKTNENPSNLNIEDKNTCLVIMWIHLVRMNP